MRKPYKKKQWTGLLGVAVIAAAVITGCGSRWQDAGKQQETNAEESLAENTKTVVTIGYLPITHALAVFEEKELLEERMRSCRLRCKSLARGRI